MANREMNTRCSIPPNSVPKQRKHVVYTAKNGNESVEVLDGEEEVKRYDYDKLNGALFSPDGRQLAFCAQQEGKSFMVVNGVEGSRYGRNRQPCF